MRRHRRIVPFLALSAACLSSPGSIAAETKTVEVRDNFAEGMSRWATSDGDLVRGEWSVVEVEHDGKPNRVLRASGNSKYKPPHRSPLNIALLKDVVVDDFELTCRVQNTNKKAAGHRDLCFFWGYQDPAHFYYVHFGSKPDPHSCQIFIVNGADRTKITKRESKGTPWDDDWHDVKIVRRAKDGTIEVYFDDMETPVMTAKDKTFTWGQIGLGTFDDHGNFDDLVLKGVAVQLPVAKKSHEADKAEN